MLPEYVFDIAQPEKNPTTLPEVQTLMDGVTIGGRGLRMYKQALNIGDAWSVLLRFVEAGTFTVTKEMFHKMNALVAKVESLEWGKFRTGSVGIAGTEYYEASLAGIRGDIRSRNRDYTRLLQCRGKSY